MRLRYFLFIYLTFVLYARVLHLKAFIYPRVIVGRSRQNPWNPTVTSRLLETVPRSRWICQRCGNPMQRIKHVFRRIYTCGIHRLSVWHFCSAFCHQIESHPPWNIGQGFKRGGDYRLVAECSTFTKRLPFGGQLWRKRITDKDDLPVLAW